MSFEDSILVDWDGVNMFTGRNAYESAFIAGSPGSGKTSASRRLLFRNLLRAEGAYKTGHLITCYKSEDADDIKKDIEECGRLEDLIEITADTKNVVNALEYQFSSDLSGELFNLDNLFLEYSGILNGTGPENSSGEARFWLAAEKKLRQMSLSLNYHAGFQFNFGNIYRIVSSLTPNESALKSITDPIELEKTLQTYVEQSFMHECLYQVQQHFGRESKVYKELSGYFLDYIPSRDARVMSSVQEGVLSLLFPIMSSNLLSKAFDGDTTIPPHLPLSEGKIILLNIPPQLYLQLGEVYQVIFMYLFMRAAERRDIRKQPHPAFLWIDECQNFLTPHLPRFILVSRSKKVGVFFITQSLTNLTAKLSGGPSADAWVKSLVGNCNLKIMHRSSDHFTCSWASETIGRTRQFMNNFGASFGQSDSTSAGFSEALEFAIPPEYFQSLKNGGPANDWLCEGIVFGQRYVHGQNFIKVTFNQRYT